MASHIFARPYSITTAALAADRVACAASRALAGHAGGALLPSAATALEGGGRAPATQLCRSPPPASPAIPCNDAAWDRRWSHYFASTATVTPPSPFHHHRSRGGSISINSAVGRAISTSTLRAAAEAVHDSDGHPAVVQLQRAARLEDQLQLLSEVPPWQDSASQDLSQKLSDYREELQHSKATDALAAAMPAAPTSQLPIPFLEDAVHSVGLEQRVLAGLTRLPRSVRRRLALAHMRRTADEHTVGEVDGQVEVATGLVGAEGGWGAAQQGGHPAASVAARPPSQEQLQCALVAAANRVIQVVVAVERVLPLTARQRRAVSIAVAEGAAAPQGAASQELLPVTACSATGAASFLLERCGMGERAAAAAVAAHPWLLGTDMTTPRVASLLECLELLDCTLQDVADLVGRYPRVLLADADKHVVPLVDYLWGLGFSQDQATGLLLRYPRAFEPGARQQLAGAVAFWVGRGLPRESLPALLSALPEVLGMSQQLVQLKFDWLAEHAAFQAEDVAVLPHALGLPLLSLVGPRFGFARHLGLRILPPSASVPQRGSADATAAAGWQRPAVADADPAQAAVQAEALLGNEEDFLRQVGGDVAAFGAFQGQWRASEFPSWLAARSELGLKHYDGLSWLEQAEATDVLALRQQRVAAQRAAAWTNQRSREKAWRSAWLTWRAEQVQREEAANRAHTAQQRKAERELRRATAELTLLLEQQRLEHADSHPIVVPCMRSEHCSKYHGHVGKCDQLKGTFAAYAGLMGPGDVMPPEDPSGQDAPHRRTPSQWRSSLGFFKRHRPAVWELPDWKPPEEGAQEPERVRACAAGMQALLERSYGGISPAAALEAWAEGQGYSEPCWRAAKGVLAVSGVAAPRLDGQHASTGKAYVRVWQLRSAAAASDEVQPRRAGRPSSSGPAVRALATSMLEAVNAAPKGVLYRRELAEWACEQRQKRSDHLVTLALHLLHEEGRAVVRRQLGVHLRGCPAVVVPINLQQYLEVRTRDDAEPGDTPEDAAGEQPSPLPAAA